MPRDPVCGQYVDENTPFKDEMEGQTVYFCSQDCLEEYEQNYDEEESVEYAEPAPRLPKDED